MRIKNRCILIHSFFPVNSKEGILFHDTELKNKMNRKKLRSFNEQIYFNEQMVTF